jgi:hypothetical protein
MAGDFLVGLDGDPPAAPAAPAALPAAIVAAIAIERMIGFNMRFTLAAGDARGLYEFIDVVAAIGSSA